jgi:hypothetical protein
MKELWIPGAMPIELILIEILTLICFLMFNLLLKKILGKGVSQFFQGTLLVLAAYSIFKYVLFPPIPSALLYTYMGLIILGVFLFLSSQDNSWKEFKEPIINTLEGKTNVLKRMRMATFVILPVLMGLGTYSFMKPTFQEPIELRTHHPAPPAKIEVHGVTIDLQKARSPFRVDEKGNYSEGIQYKYRNANLFGS